jgi:hypothetical protein
MRWIVLLLFIVKHCSAVSNSSLVAAFASVFGLQDDMSATNNPVLLKALMHLDKMGINSSLTSVCSLPDDVVANLLMKAALAEYVTGLKDPNDWQVVVADASTGQLTRQRSFSATRFAVMESLLLVAVAALGRVVWIGNKV